MRLQSQDPWAQCTQWLKQFSVLFSIETRINGGKSVIQKLIRVQRGAEIKYDLYIRIHTLPWTYLIGSRHVVKSSERSSLGVAGHESIRVMATTGKNFWFVLEPRCNNCYGSRLVDGWIVYRRVRRRHATLGPCHGTGVFNFGSSIPFNQLIAHMIYNSLNLTAKSSSTESTDPLANTSWEFFLKISLESKYGRSELAYSILKIGLKINSAA